jgi:1-acyl-sn-glycerol-3-phosphate acyltransferase
LTIVHILRTALVLVFVVLFAVCIALPFMLYSVIRGSSNLLYRVTRVGVRAFVRMAGVRVRVEGLENIPSGVCVFVANHVSHVDPPVLVAVIPRQIAVVAKKELFRIPILGPAMRMAYFLPIDRSNRKAAADSIEEAIRNLRSGVSYLSYPEGTRSADGRLRPFKKGSFVMAIDAGVPVVPITVIGAQHLMRKGEWFVRPGSTTVRFLPALEGTDSTAAHKLDLLQRVYESIAASLPPEQQPLAQSKAEI